MPDPEWHENDHPRSPNGQYISVRDFLERIFDERWRSHQDQHRAEQKAIDLAARTVETWKVDSNEWRQTLGDRDRTFATKSELDPISRRLEVLERVNIRTDETERVRLIAEAEEKRLEERRQSTERYRVGVVVTIISVVVSAVVALALHFVK